MIFKIIGAALLLSLTAFVLREFGWRGAPVFVSVAALLLIGSAASRIGEILKLGEEIFSAEEGGEVISAAVKTLGVSYLFGIACDACSSLGEGSIARALEVAGRIEIAVIITPYFLKIIELGREMLL